MRFSTSVPHKARRVLKLEDLRGVDMSSPALLVSKKRASRMRNLISEYGVNRKRHGWRELFRIPETDGVYPAVNGVFEYRLGEQHAYIVHAGTRFYRVSDDHRTVTDITETCTYPSACLKTDLIQSTKSQSFLSDGRLYIIGCGDYLVYGSWDGGQTFELRRVYDNSDTYIPTTTISIDHDGAVDPVRAVLDPVNRLSPRRKNTCVGVSMGTASTSKETWTMDSPIKADSRVTVEIETMESGELVKRVYDNGGADPKNLYLISVDDVPITNGLYVSTVTVNGVQVEHLKGEIDFAKGKITLKRLSCPPPVSGRDNIIVTFYPDSEQSDEGETITSCGFGVLFGVSSQSDRLFLSGSPSKPNYDYYSESDDFTFFPDIYYTRLGTERFAITAYSRLTDGTLAIFKSSDGSEPGIYYRTGRYVTAYDSQGTALGLTAEFPISAGNVSEGVISRFACAGFYGDPLILSENGVYGIVLAKNVSTTERYVRERSRTVNAHLVRHDLSGAVATVYKGRYYLAVDDCVYVADSRYKISADDPDGAYGYEWWYWDGVPAHVLTTIDDKLCFGDKYGRVCAFYDGFSDVSYDVFGEGKLTCDDSIDRLTYDHTIGVNVSDGDAFSFDSENIYALAFGSYECDGNTDRIYVSDVSHLHEQDELWYDVADSSSIPAPCDTRHWDFFDVPLTVCDVDRAGNSFILKNSFGDTFPPAFIAGNTNADSGRLVGHGRFSRRISGISLTVTDTDGESSSFSLKLPSGGRVDFIRYKNTALPNSVLGRLTHSAPVVAEWYSAALDLGDHSCQKTLYSLSVACETGIGHALSFGYDTRLSGALSPVHSPGGFSLSDLSFEDFTLAGGLQSSYTLRCYETGINYIMFRFLSESASDCAFYSLLAEYKPGRREYGVR